MGFNDLFKKSILEQFEKQSNLPKTDIVMTLLIVSVFSIYIYLVYKTISKKGFYSPTFAKTLVGMAIITTGIVLAMQVNVLVSLGMVGALSIVRFRTVIKDPMDLLFLFWSISVGIICGTGVHLIALFTSLLLTALLFTLDFLPNKSLSYILVLKCSPDVNEEQILSTLKLHCKNPMIRTRNHKKDQIDLLIELKTKKDSAIVNDMMAQQGVQTASLIAHDGEVRY